MCVGSYLSYYLHVTFVINKKNIKYNLKKSPIYISFWASSLKGNNHKRQKLKSDGSTPKKLPS